VSNTLLFHSESYIQKSTTRLIPEDDIVKASGDSGYRQSETMNTIPDDKDASVDINSHQSEAMNFFSDDEDDIKWAQKFLNPKASKTSE
jgi:hypothetical protein